MRRQRAGRRSTNARGNSARRRDVGAAPRVRLGGGARVCHGYLAHPTLTLHAMVFGTYVLGFWAHSLVAGSTWLLDAARPLLPL